MTTARPPADKVVSRRHVLGALTLGTALVACSAGPGTSDGTTASPSGRDGAVASGGDLPRPRRSAYGDDPSQYAELILPAGDPRGTVVMLHGGFWRAAYGADLQVPTAIDLAGRGWAVWNLEYRRVGSGGGWPQTFNDVAAGVDHLRAVADSSSLDLSRVVAVGHSAGGHLATWLAGRPRLPASAPGADPAVTVAGVVSLAGVVELTRAAEASVGGTAVLDLMGGLPRGGLEHRYSLADPRGQLPLGVPVRCVHDRADAQVPFWQSEDYVRAAQAAGDDARLVEVPGDHFSLIDPTTPAWAAAREQVEQLAG